MYSPRRGRGAAAVMCCLLGILHLHAREVTVTAYCGCTKCCGQWSGINRTAAGTVPKAGRTIAATPEYKLGQRVRILGRTYIVEDRMSRRYKSNRIDIYMNNHTDAVKFGVKKVRL